MYDVIIIGAGVIGCILARELSRYKLKVLVLEKDWDVSMGATKANSGIIHGGYAEGPDTLKGRLCYPGRTRFDKLEEELSFGYRKTGSLVISADPSDAPALRGLKEQGEQNGVPDLRLLGRDEILSLEPNLNPAVIHALYCEGAGVCSPYEFAIALAENAAANGAEFRFCHPVTAVERLPGGFLVTAPRRLPPSMQARREGDGLIKQRNNLSSAAPGSAGHIFLSESKFKGRFVINCAGVYSDKVSRLAGADYFTIHPRKGEYILFTKGTGKVLNTVVFQMPTAFGKGILVTSTYHGNLMIGPDARDTGDPEDTSTEPENIKNILEKAKFTTDQFDVKQFLRTFSGLRAISSTHDFIIEETEVPGFINAAGIQSPGLTASPAIADRIITILADSGLDLPPNPGFNPVRQPIIIPKNMPMKEAVKLSELPPGRAERIICKCEQVTEKEVVDCLERGIPVITVDGVKRRTRAGMGFCQGSFCRKRVTEMLEARYGDNIIADEDIVHSGINRVTKKELLD